MKKHLVALGLLFTLFAKGAVSPPVGYNDTIFDDYTESSPLSVHSRGLFSYALRHTNTARIRKAFVRGNYQLKDTQIFFTLNGYQDTHDSGTDHPFVGTNVGIYDYGAIYRFHGFFASLRGAATYRENQYTFLLIPAYYNRDNPGETDAQDQYLPVHRMGPGVRLGYTGDNFEIGVSQGDYRHMIPQAVVAKMFFDATMVRLALFSEYLNGFIYTPSSRRLKGQLSVLGNHYFTDNLSLGYMGEVTVQEGGFWWLRLEVAANYHDFILAMREIFQSTYPPTWEIALKKRIEKVSSIGVHYATVGRAYLALEVEF